MSGLRGLQNMGREFFLRSAAERTRTVEAAESWAVKSRPMDSLVELRLCLYCTHGTAQYEACHMLPPYVRVRSLSRPYDGMDI